MQYNHLQYTRMKWAAMLVAGIFAHPSAYALGLGEIQVKSHLGQPLKALVKVYGAADIKHDTACLSLNTEGASFLGSTQLKLRPLNADEAMLTITSSQAVNEPIVNLSVSTICEAEMRREYVLLLDPVMSSETEAMADDEEVMADADSNTPSLAVTPPKVKKHAQKSGNKRNKNKSLGQNPTSTGATVISGAAQARRVQSANTAQTGRATLSISGGTYGGLPAYAMRLHMDRQLMMRPNAADPVPAGDAEVLDELTAMNNRLKHLTTQISQLQQNNLRLAEENAAKTKALAHNQNQLSQFRQFGIGLGALLLLLSGQLALGWWRRRKAHLAVLDRITLQKQEEISSDDDLFASEEPRQPIDIADENSAFKPDDFGLDPENTDPFVVEESDQEMSVLEHADVFLSHGRAELAIQMLQSHLLEHPKQSVTLWLFLLDLLAKQNLHALYEQTAQECKDHFNVNIPGFDAKPAATAHSLEAYPHLSSGLQAVWGTPAAITFLDDLIYNNRLEPRAGFDKQLIEELLALKSVAQERASLAEVIQLEEKKMALKERKEAQLAAKKAEKLQQLEETINASEVAKQAEQAKEKETKFDFGLIEWN
jgi:hypothetical protein